MDIVGKKYLYFAISILVMVPGILALFLYGLNLSIDFTGGTRLTYDIPSTNGRIQNAALEEVIEEQQVEVGSVQSANDNNTYIIRTKPIDEQKHQQVKQAIENQYPAAREISYETVGPTIGQEITANAFKAILAATFLIVLYIALSFRKVPKPASSWRFGICAVVALVHDVLVTVGIFAILGHFLHVEIDSLFVTAILTVIGFSVHDTIVVFDRIRENLRRMPDMSFATVANASIVQTIGRSLSTSVTVILVLFTMLLFGGETIKWFVVALLIGIISGTYSSIFNAAPLLVLWHEWSEKRKKNKKIPYS